MVLVIGCLCLHLTLNLKDKKMTYFTITTDTAGQGGIFPRRVKIVTSDNLATVTTQGYLNLMSPTSVLLNTDVVDMIYSYSPLPDNGTYAIFTVQVNVGTITLTEWTNGGDVLLPVVSGDAAIFNGTTGQIADAGAPPVLVSSSSPQTITSSTSSPAGNFGSLFGITNKTATVVTSGFCSSVFGRVIIGSVSGGNIYGIDGQVDINGTLSSGAFIAGASGAIDATGATLTGGSAAFFYGYMQATSAIFGPSSNLYGIYLQNNTASIADSMFYSLGAAKSIFNLNDNNGVAGPTYFIPAGNGAGKAGDATKCNASNVLTIKVNGTNYWIPLFALN